ncbi:hypothetical protein [uncultured Muriicola sp.]|uniref:hypothetical protein n=1 Tax=uncultured Muriicola sp. TaxID=1583102 RepID=UPI002621FF9B|nr:hypothetical protein [uncultured Muriicola sp.]
MKKLTNLSSQIYLMMLLFSLVFTIQSWKQTEQDVEKETIVETEKPEFIIEIELEIHKISLNE